MTALSIGDLARTLTLMRGAGQAKQDLNRLTAELTSGRTADPAARMRGHLAPLAAVEASLARIDGWQSAARALDLRASAMQSALGALHAIGGTQAAALLQAGATHQPDLVDLTGRDARDHLEAAVGLLNAQAGGQSLFAGTRSDQPALAGADTLLDAAWSVAGSAPSPEAALTTLRAWFDDPAGFEAQIYLGGARQAAVAVGPELSVGIEATAVDPALKELLVGLTGAALLDRGLFEGHAAARQQIARQSGEALTANAGERVALAARIGLGEQRLAQAQTRNATEAAALDIARAGMLEADPYATASALEQAETRLGLVHVLTARLQDLSLLRALR